MNSYKLDQETFNRLDSRLKELEKGINTNSMIAQEIKQILQNTEIVEVEEDTFNIGDKVYIVFDNDFENPELVRLVAVASTSAGEISISSPVGKALIGKKMGETVTLPTGHAITIISKVLEEEQTMSR